MFVAAPSGAAFSQRSLRKSIVPYGWDRDLSWQDIFDHVARALYLCGSGGSWEIAQLGVLDSRLPIADRLLSCLAPAGAG
jgi:hypothetical protein